MPTTLIPPSSVLPAGTLDAPSAYCTRRSHWLPATREFFNVRPDGRPHTWCRACGAEHRRERRAAIARGDVVPRTRAPRQAIVDAAVSAAVVGSAAKFGVEIEFLGSSTVRDRLLAELRSRGLTADFEGYNHTTRAYWKIVTDGSLSGAGYELVSPPLSGDEGRAALRLACQALVAAGARVDSRCGLHVHHDAAALDAPGIGRAVRSWASSQDAIDLLVSPSRRGTGWCRRLSASEVRHAEALRSTDRTTVQVHFRNADRYRALNVAAYARQGTLEIRQHQGTLNAEKILAWVAFGQAMFAAAAAGERVAETTVAGLLSALVSRGGLPAESAAFLQRRADAFARNADRVAA